MFGALVGVMDPYRKLDGGSQTHGSSLSQTRHDRFHSPQQRQLERSRSRVKNTVVLTPTGVWLCIVMNTFKEQNRYIFISPRSVYWLWIIEYEFFKTVHGCMYYLFFSWISPDTSWDFPSPLFIILFILYWFCTGAVFFFFSLLVFH